MWDLKVTTHVSDRQALLTGQVLKPDLATSVFFYQNETKRFFDPMKISGKKKPLTRQGFKAHSLLIKPASIKELTCCLEMGKIAAENK